eukprot:6205921-Prymnesium_polylepis.1
MLSGLAEDRAALNGKAVVAVRFQMDVGRWAVRLEQSAPPGAAAAAADRRDAGELLLVAQAKLVADTRWVDELREA